jgi:hypothetical protein
MAAATTTAAAAATPIPTTATATTAAIVDESATVEKMMTSFCPFAGGCGSGSFVHMFMCHAMPLPPILLLSSVSLTLSLPRRVNCRNVQRTRSHTKWPNGRRRAHVLASEDCFAFSTSQNVFSFFFSFILSDSAFCVFFPLFCTSVRASPLNKA